MGQNPPGEDQNDLSEMKQPRKASSFMLHSAESSPFGSLARGELGEEWRVAVRGTRKLCSVKASG